MLVLVKLTELLIVLTIINFLLMLDPSSIAQLALATQLASYSPSASSPKISEVSSSGCQRGRKAFIKTVAFPSVGAGQLRTFLESSTSSLALNGDRRVTGATVPH